MCGRVSLTRLQVEQEPGSRGSDPQHFFHHYIKVHVSNGKIDLTVRRINAANVVARFYYLLKYYPVEGGLLLCFVISALTLWLKRERINGKESP